MMNSKTSSILALVIAIIALVIVVARPASNEMATPNKHETAFERVVRTNTLRCGYATWTPEMVKDPNTGQLSGYDYDVTTAIGRVLGLKVEWVEEVGWGVAEEGLIWNFFLVGNRLHTQHT